VPSLQTRTTIAPRPALRRELGRWDLTAIGVNQVIGASVFALPAALAGLVGGWSPLLIVAVGFASLLIAATFAEVGSRFDGTGGPYLYTRAAFGRFAAFEVGWMQWFTRVASWASVINVLVASLGFYWPSVTTGATRIAFMTAVIVLLAMINVVGIRQSAWVVNTFAISKLIPLVVFIAVGLPAIDATRLAAGGTPTLSTVSSSALLLIFGFGGYEVIPVPAGEAKDPRRGVPFALLMTIVVVAIILTLVQIAALGTLPGLAQSKTPLAEASARLMGAAGAALITFGAVMSTTGNNMGQALSGSRALFALAEQGDLPRILARVNVRFGTPVTAILVTAAISLVLAVTGTFVTMGVASAVSRLVVYVGTCASALRLRSAAFVTHVAPPTFMLPLGPLVPSAAIAIALCILVSATPRQLVAGGGALAAGAVLFVVAARPLDTPRAS
jgi:basic amino acid/polyamine antiporter, APA family